MNASPDHVVLGPRRWETAAKALPEPARHLLELAHDRHIPLTPDLARHFFTQSLGERSLTDLAIDACRGALAQKPRVRHAFACRPEIVFDFVLAPIVRQAAVNIGKVVLHGAKGMSQISDRDVEQYRKDIDAETMRLIAEPDVMGSAFWHTAAVAVLGDGLAMAASRSTRRAGRGGLNIGVEPDRDLTSIVCATEPLFETPPVKRLRARIARQTSWRRAGIKPKEGGIEGIRATRSLDEIDDALQSTFCLPPEMLMVKFTEEGFLVKHRPPSRQPRRDLLVALLAPDGLHDGTSKIAVAAWIDACIRLWPILHKSRVMRADLGFATERLGGLRTAAMRLDHVPLIPVSDPFILSREARLSLLMNSNLAPSVFDGNPSSIPSRRRVDLLGAPQVILDTICTAFASVPAMRQAGRSGVSVADAGDLSIYNAILALQIVREPSEEMGPPAGQEVLRELQLPDSTRPLGVRIDLPATGAPDAPFHINSSRNDSIAVHWEDTDDDAERLARMIGQLSLVFIDLALEALADG